MVIIMFDFELKLIFIVFLIFYVDAFVFPVLRINKNYKMKFIITSFLLMIFPFINPMNLFLSVNTGHYDRAFSEVLSLRYKVDSKIEVLKVGIT